MTLGRCLAVLAALAFVAITPLRVSSASPRYSWHLIFHDDFNEKGLNTQRWASCWPYMPTLACTNSNEAEFYRPGNVAVSGGMLRLTARRQRATAQGWKPRQYTSGMVTTAGKFHFRYGFAQVRMKVPPGVGFWIGFWLMPTDRSWPPEIDVMEHLGLHPTVSGMAYHWVSRSKRHTANRWLDVRPKSWESSWHTYGMDWEPGKIRWYIDGKLENQYVGDVTAKRMWLNLTFAMSSNPQWGVPNQSTHFPSTVAVDYVRVWQASGSPSRR